MSIKKVATIAGVSIATVSRYFNTPNQVSKHTREKVEQAIKQVNYSPNSLAQNLRRGKTGLIIAVVHKLSSAFYGAITDQLSIYAEKNGYRLFVKQIQDHAPSLDEYRHMLRSKQADGFILFTGLPLPSEEMEAFSDFKLPIVLACETSHTDHLTEIPSVGINDQKAAKEATQHLIVLGHTKIALIDSSRQEHKQKQRLGGYQQAMAASKLSTLTAYNSKTASNRVKEQLDTLLSGKNRPSAIICAEDNAAVEALHYVKQCGYEVPHDISIIGFNNLPNSALTEPPLTTIETPTEDISTIAYDILLALINKNAVPSKHVVLPHSLLLRGTTSKPREKIE